MSSLGRSIDELEGDFLEVSSLGGSSEGKSESDGSLLGTGDGTLDHDPVVPDDTVVGESSHRGDPLVLGQVMSGGSIGLHTISLLGDSVDLLGDLTSVMVSVLTSSGDLELDLSRVPSSDTGDLSQTSMSLSGKSGHTPSGDDTVDTSTLGDGEDINDGSLLLGEDVGDSDIRLEESLDIVDLGLDGSTVDLDLFDVSLSSSEVLDEGGLGVDDGSDGGAVLLGSGDLGFHLTGGVLGGVLGVGLLLGLVEVLVEGSLEGVIEMSSHDGGQGSVTSGGVDVSDETNDLHGGGLDDGDGLNDLLLVDLRVGSVSSSLDVSHTGLEPHEGGQVTGLGGIILGKGLDLSVVMLGSLLREKSQVSVSGAFEFSMRHCV